MLMSFSVPVFAGMLFLDLMTKSGTFRFFALAALSFVLPVSGASAGSLGGHGAHAAPFGYPSTALNAPATLAQPPAAYVQIGRERLQLGEAELETAALRWGAARLREGTGLFERDYACFEGTESGKPILLWLISSDLKTVTEAQLERVTPEQIPAHCGKLVGTDLPVRLGRVGLDMTPKRQRLSAFRLITMGSAGSSGLASAFSKMPADCRNWSSIGLAWNFRMVGPFAVLLRL